MLFIIIISCSRKKETSNTNSNNPGYVDDEYADIDHTVNPPNGDGGRDGNDVNPGIGIPLDNLYGYNGFEN